MDVLFLKNPNTGEVRRFFVKEPIPVESLEGWDVVDGLAWAEANADHVAVNAAVARHRANAGDVFAGIADDEGEVGWDDPAIENTVEYWRKIAADNLALAATNGDLLANAQSELDTRLRELMLLEGERNRLRAKLASAEAALRPFAELYEQWLNRLIVDMSFPEWLEIKLTVQEQNGNYTRQYFEDAAKALKASAQGGE